MTAPPQLSSSLNAQGFHFTLTTRLTPRAYPPAANCTLHLLHVLPPDVYADQYELAQRPGLSAESLTGASDLELPVGAVDEGGSVLLLEVREGVGEDGELVVDVPLHARYGRPNLAGGYHTIQLERPTGFWACPQADLVNTKHAEVPPELAALIPSDFFRTSALHTVPYAPVDHTLEVVIPVGNLADLAVVDVGTATVVLLCFLYLAFVSVQTACRLHLHHAPRTHKTE